MPAFVHHFGGDILIPPNAPPPNLSKGVPLCHPDVTMRLETPVLYFYPSAGWKPQPVDVHVSFVGGWLTEFYPDAVSKAQGFSAKKTGHIDANAVGDLSWKNLTVSADGAGPETAEKVWLAPRSTKSAMVKTENGESEKFLFYRGVANADASVRIVRDDVKKTLEATSDPSVMFHILQGEETKPIPGAWLVDVQPDGACAFKSINGVEYWNDRRAVLPTSFDVKDFSQDNLPRLKNEMRSALIAKGLFAEEADALLTTWEVSYFKNPGLRFFYLCPDIVTNLLLPLGISVPCDVTRVMIGRIEIVTPEQRTLLKKIAAGSVTVFGFKLQKFGIYNDYLKLGRFRNALILDEQNRRPTPELGEFISKNGFEAYRIE